MKNTNVSQVSNSEALLTVQTAKKGEVGKKIKADTGEFKSALQKKALEIEGNNPLAAKKVGKVVQPNKNLKTSKISKALEKVDLKTKADAHVKQLLESGKETEVSEDSLTLKKLSEEDLSESNLAVPLYQVGKVENHKAIPLPVSEKSELSAIGNKNILKNVKQTDKKQIKGEELIRELLSKGSDLKGDVDFSTQSTKAKIGENSNDLTLDKASKVNAEQILKGKKLQVSESEEQFSNVMDGAKLDTKEIKNLATSNPKNEKLSSGDDDVRELGLSLGAGMPGSSWEFKTAMGNLSQDKVAFNALEKLKEELKDKFSDKKESTSKKVGEASNELRSIVETLKDSGSPMKAGIAEFKKEGSDIRSIDMSSQIEKHLDHVVFQPGQKVKVILQPEELGNVQLIAKEVGGKMEIDMIVDRPDTLQKLQKDSQSFIEGVSERTGVQISHFNVKQSDASSGNQSNDSSPQNNQGNLSQDRRDNLNWSGDRNNQTRRENFADSQSLYGSSTNSEIIQNDLDGKNTPSTLYGGRVSIKA